jgi:hypothetical protein
VKSNDPCPCGACEQCLRRATLNVTGHVVQRRFEQRGTYDRSDPKERKYVHRQARLLLAMTGLGDESMISTEELRRSEWGKAMRARQSSQ